MAAARYPSAPKRILDDITVAQRALVEARGRLLEAREAEELEAVLVCLRRASTHINQAAQGCFEMKRKAEDSQ